MNAELLDRVDQETPEPLDLEHEFLLVCEANADPTNSHGTWRFVIEHLDGQPFLDASDVEEGDGNRLALWAIVRGLEALPGPASVTMLTSSRYVIRSMSECLPRWRAANFEWEYFGTRLPVSNADLWRRVDRAFGIHQVSACCVAAAPHLGRNRRTNPVPQRRAVSVTDGLRSWLLAQCGVGGTPTAGSLAQGSFAIA